MLSRKWVRCMGALQLSTRLSGVSPPVTRRLRVAEQTSLAELHAALQVAFGWSPPFAANENPRVQSAVAR